MKKNFFMYLILLIIGGSVVGLGLYAKEANVKEDEPLQNNQTKKEEKKEEKKENLVNIDDTILETNIEEDISLNNYTVSKLIKMVVGSYNSICSSDQNQDVFRKTKSLKADDISMYTKLSLTAQYITANESTKSYIHTNSSSTDPMICGLSYISEDDMKKVYYEIFGEEAKYERSSFDVNWDTYNWSEENNRYESQIKCGKGGTCPGGSVSKPAYAKKINNEIQIYEYYAFIDIDDKAHTYHIYGDYEKTNLVVDAVMFEDEIFKKYSDKVDLYKYTFKRNGQNDNYYFYSVEKVER